MLFWWLTLLLCARPLLLFSLDFALESIQGSADADNAHFFNVSERNDRNRGLMGVKTTDWQGNLIPGEYTFVSSSNFDAYLRELGVGFILRRLARLASPYITITRALANQSKAEEPENCWNQTVWTIRTDTLVRSHEVSFCLDEPSTDITMDGRHVSFQFTKGAKSNELIEEQSTINSDTNLKEKSNGKTTLVRRFTPDAMYVDMDVNNVTASSIFRRVQDLIDEETKE